MLQHHLTDARTFPLDTLPRLTPAIAPESRVLHSVRKEDCNLAIWQRRPAHDWSALLTLEARDIRFDAAAGAIAQPLAAALVRNGFGAPALHRAFTDDAVMLAELFGAITGASGLQVRIEVVTTDSCCKFHADYVTARLITTYAGAGTQWLAHEDAERARSGAEPHRINQLETGDVGIFRGRLWGEYPAIHRSPPIAGSGTRRLLLVLNPLERA